MNLQELLLNAYKNGAAVSPPNDESKKNESVVSKPVFQKFSKNSTDSVKPFSFEKISKIPTKTSSTVAQTKPASTSSDAVSNRSMSTRPVQSSYTNNDVSVAARALTSGGLLKVPALPREKDGRENVYRRVAKFLLLIGVDEAAKILPRLSEEQTEKIIPEIASIRKVEPEEAEEILSEFQSLIARSREEGGVDTAREMLEKAFGTEKAQKFLDNAAANLPIKPFEYLSEADGEKVTLLLKDESAAVRALVLSYLNPKVAAEVVRSFAPMERREVFLRLANLKKINPDVLRRVDAAMHEKVNKLNVQRSDSIDGRSALAEILRRMEPGAEDEILETLAESDSALGEDLRNRLFTTEDVLRADDRFLQEYLRNMEDRDVAFLIAGKSEDFRSKILKNVSQTRSKEIERTQEILRPMKKSEVEKVAAKFIVDMRNAYDSGKLVVLGRDGEEYV